MKTSPPLPLVASPVLKINCPLSPKLVVPVLKSMPPLTPLSPAFTVLSMMLPLLHHGMVLVGLPYSEPQLSTTSSGGTPYGASHHAGVASAPKPPGSDELALAEALGRRVANIAVRLAA